MPSKEELQTALKEVVAALQEAVAGFKVARGPLAVLKAAIKAVPVAVSKVEEIGRRLGIQGADKKALAVDALLAVLKLPWWLPRRFVRVVLDEVIDAIVEAMNRQLNRFKP